MKRLAATWAEQRANPEVLAKYWNHLRGITPFPGAPNFVPHAVEVEDEVEDVIVADEQAELLLAAEENEHELGDLPIPRVAVKRRRDE